MSTALVVYEYKFPVNRGHKSIVPATSYDRLGMLPETLPAIYHEAGRSGWIVDERQMENYGPNARIISTLSPGMIVDIYI